jgi:hypothetical protein
MCMNITLSADDRLIERARAAATARGTTLNQLIRDYMSHLAGESDARAIADELRRNALEGAGRSEPGWRFDRDAIHERGRR